MIISTSAAAIFILFWLLGLINWVVMMVTQTQLQKLLESNYPQIRNNLKLKYSSTNEIFPAPFSYFKVLASFGSAKSSQIFTSQFVDTEAIDQLKDERIHKLKNRLISTTSNNAKIWTCCLLSAILGIVLLSIVRN